MSANSTVMCANGACAKHLDLSKDTPNVLCPLCASTDTVYCSEACRMIDWVGHKCDNAFLIAAAVGQKQATLFVPYHFEDRLDAKEHKQWVESMTPEARIEAENQHYLLQVNHPDQTVSQHLIRVGESLTFRPMDPKLETVFRRGAEPHPAVKEASFRIKITVGTSTVISMEGNVDAHAIYKNHKTKDTDMGGKLIQYLLNRRKESSDTVLFVKPTADDALQSLPLEGTMTIEVEVNGRPITTATGPYKMRAFGFEFTRAIGKFLNPRLKALFPKASDANIKDFKMLRATLGHTEFILIFEVGRHKKLRNIAEQDKIMFFRGLVYQVSAAALQSRAGLLPSQYQPEKKDVTEESDVLGVDSGESASPPLSPSSVVPVVVPSSLPQPVIVPGGEGGEVGGTTVSLIPPPPPRDDVDEASITPPPPPPGAPIPEKVVAGRDGGGVSAETLGGVKLRPSKPNTASAPAIPQDQNDIRGTLEKAFASMRPAHAPDEPSTLDPWPADKQAIFPLRCDASNVSQLVGLAMALELRERELPPYATTASALVRNHARALMEKRVADPSAVPMDVSAAVYSSIQALHELPAHQ
jgi:hypothetical protein